MKFTLAQLRKLSFPYEYHETLDLSDKLNGLEDILKSGPCDVYTAINLAGEDDYVLNFDIEIDIVVQDAVSLKEIPLHLDIKSKELYSTDKDKDDCTIIEGLTLDTSEAIIASILENKPMTSTNEDFADEIDEEDEKEENVNPAFASLKDLLN